MQGTSSHNKRIAKNTIALYCRMFFVLLVSLYSSRVVLNTLGVEDYGVYNVVAGFVSLFGFFNATLSASMQRFYNYEGTRCGKYRYNNVYATGFIIHLLICLVIFVLMETVGLWYVNHIMVVPYGRNLAINILYQTSIISMIFVVLQIPFLGAIMAAEKMNYYALISIIDVVLKLIAVIILPSLTSDKLIVYGILLLLITLFDFFSYFIYAARGIVDIHTKIVIDPNIFKALLSFSGWNLLGTFVYLLKGQGLNMILNFFFGPVINTARGISYQVSGAINGFAANIGVAFRPQLVNAYAEGNISRTRKMMFVQSKVCYFLLLMLIVPVVLELDMILRLWLGNIIPEQTYLFTILVLVDTLICSLNSPFTQVVSAVGKLKTYQIANSLVNVILLPLSFFALKIGCNEYSVFYLTIIVSVLNQAVCIIYADKIFPINIRRYLKEIIGPCALISIFIPIVPYCITLLMDSSILRLTIIVFIEIPFALLIGYYILLNSEEKQQFLCLLDKYLKKSH